MGFPDSSVGKESTCNAGDPGSIPGLGRSAGEGIGYPVQLLGFPCGSVGKESTGNVGELGSIPGLGRSPGEGNGYPLQYSGLENSMDCIVCGVAKSQTPLIDFHFVTKHHSLESPPSSVLCLSAVCFSGYSLVLQHHWLLRVRWAKTCSVGTDTASS